MNSSCKLLSASVALKKDGMTKEYLATHHELISGVTNGEKRSVMVTFGLYAKPEVPIGIYASVNPIGEEPPINKNKYAEGFYRTLNSSPLSDGMGVFLITLEVQDVHFEHSGLYEVNARIFPSETTPSTENEIDSIRCFFYALTSVEGRHATVK